MCLKNCTSVAAIVVIEMALHFAVNFKQQVQLSIEFIAFIATRITYMMLALVAHEMKQKEFTLKKKCRTSYDGIFVTLFSLRLFVSFFLAVFSLEFSILCARKMVRKRANGQNCIFINLHAKHQVVFHLDACKHIQMTVLAMAAVAHP